MRHFYILFLLALFACGTLASSSATKDVQSHNPIPHQIANFPMNSGHKWSNYTMDTVFACIGFLLAVLFLVVGIFVLMYASAPGRFGGLALIFGSLLAPFLVRLIPKCVRRCEAESNA